MLDIEVVKNIRTTLNTDYAMFMTGSDNNIRNLLQGAFLLLPLPPPPYFEKIGGKGPEKNTI